LPFSFSSKDKERETEKATTVACRKAAQKAARRQVAVVAGKASEASVFFFIMF